MRTMNHMFYKVNMSQVGMKVCYKKTFRIITILYRVDVRVTARITWLSC